MYRTTIETVAATLLQACGRDAPAEAAWLAARSGRAGDAVEFAFWSEVMTAVELLLAGAAAAGETLH